jgi:TPR repeat protein
MNGSVTIVYQGQSFHSSFNLADYENLTYETWNELYQKAQSHHIPYYIMAAVIVQNSSTTHCHLYDGVTLHKALKANQRDPSTNLPIQKVHYLFFKCAQYMQSDSFQPTLPLLPLKSPIRLEKDDCLTNFIQHESLSDLFFDSLNLHTAEEGSNQEITRLAQTQFVIGTQLIALGESLKGLRWIWGAANKGIPAAQKLLGLHALDYVDSKISSNVEEGEKWLQLAASQGDQEAASLLELQQHSDEESADESN